MASPLIAVLVLYRMQLQQSRCYQSLLQSFVDGPALAPFALIIYDNSPELSNMEAIAYPGKLMYHHDPHNGGVAAAYNFGLQHARDSNAQWLLLLDQDTELTSDYLMELLAAVSTAPPAVAAIIPRLMQHGAIHSPQRLPRLSHQPLESSWSGLLREPITAYNSGAALRVSAVTRFPARYWLDFLDHAVFHEVQAAGGRVWLLKAGLSHQLSTENLGTDASLERYLNVLQAERDFYADYGSPADRSWYHLRRVKQAVGELLKVSDKRFALLSLRAALSLLPPTPPR